MRAPLLAFTLILGGLSAARAQENLRFQLDSTWQANPANVSEVRNQYLIMEFVKKGERIDNWTELVTLQNFNRGWGRRTPHDTYEALRGIRERECPGATRWEVVAEDRASILYQSVTTGCAGQPDQSELARLLFARNNRYRISYTTKGELGPDKRATWVQWLSALATER